MNPDAFNVTLDDGTPRTLQYAAGAACAYHGYRRNRSVFWAVVWGALGLGVPIIAVPVAIAQGFGKRKEA